MNIGIVCYPTFGGSGVLATELGMAFAKRGYNVHFISYNQPVRLDFLTGNIHYHEVSLEEYPLFKFQPYNLALSSKIVQVVEDFGLDILHVHYAIPHAYAAYMAKQMLKDKGIEIKIVTTLHGTDITLVGSHPDYKTAVEFSINQSDEVTAVSNSLKSDTLKLFNIKKDIKVVYNFISPVSLDHETENNSPRSLLANSDEFILCHVSNFRPVKRVGDVIKVFDIVQREVGAKLLMVGDGPERIKAENLALELGIKDKIVFLGYSSEIIKILNYADIFLLPSETESFGLAALEAMSAGTPVISTNTGGLPEINKNGYTGYLSNIGAVDEMARNTLSILSDKDVLLSFKENAKKHVQLFSIDATIQQYEFIYSSI